MELSNWRASARLAASQARLRTSAAAHAVLRCLGSNMPLRGVTVFVVLVTFLFTRGDRMSLGAAAAASTQHQYGLITWELANFMDKWTYRVWLFMPWVDDSEERRREALDRYLELTAELRDATAMLERTAASPRLDQTVLDSAQRDVDRLISERDSLRNIVEEYLEAEISKTLTEYGFGGAFLWPPVDFRLDTAPSVLVVSPRDVIRREDTVLIEPDISVFDMERIETKLGEEHDVSAAILRTGGLASYPTVIPSDRDLLGLLEVAAHEWLHTYLFFRPLGRSFFSGGEMVTLNETLADMFGREIGRVTYNRITGNHVEPVVAPSLPSPDEPGDPGQFSFRSFMRETRLRVDDTLERGEIEEAEAYMEARRQTLAEDHGVFIRKLNQAYFAFTGSYGESGSSVSPLPFELWELRLKSGGLAGLVRAVENVSSTQEFRNLLAEFEIEVDLAEARFR